MHTQEYMQITKGCICMSLKQEIRNSMVKKLYRNTEKVNVEIISGAT